MPRVLVVDDEKIISSSIARVLARAAHTVSTANNGLEALAILQKESFDLVILDLLMPEIGGGEVLDWLHSNRPQTRVILMTAYGDQHLKEDLHRRGAARVLAKPFDDILQFPKIVEDALK